MNFRSALALILGAMLSVVAPGARAGSLGTGIYWNPQFPGWAIYAEQQKDTVFAIVYAYSSTDAEPEFFVASGPIVADIPIDADNSYVGLFPIPGLVSPLYRVPSGSCLGCVSLRSHQASALGRWVWPSSAEAPFLSERHLSTAGSSRTLRRKMVSCSSASTLRSAACLPHLSTGRRHGRTFEANGFSRTRLTARAHRGGSSSPPKSAASISAAFRCAPARCTEIRAGMQSCIASSQTQLA